MITIDSERCNGCGACVEVCPVDAIWLVEGIDECHAEIDQSLCRVCQACIEVCPEHAIQQVEAEPAIEGELVPAELQAVPVKAALQETQPIQPTIKSLAWLGPALAFVGREILPRAAALLLDAWDRRANSRATTARGPDTQLSTRQSTPGSLGSGGRRNRRRGGWGG